MSGLNALIGIDFSLIGTKLHAAFEKSGEDGFAVLLIPSVQEADNGISLAGVIDDIQKLVSGSGSEASAEDMQQSLQSALDGVAPEKGDARFSLENVIVKLDMAYLYIRKGPEQADNILEYAFQLQIITEGLIPREIAQIVDVSNISLSVWNTDRKKVVDQMRLVTLNEYLGLPAGAGEQTEQTE